MGNLRPMLAVHYSARARGRWHMFLWSLTVLRGSQEFSLPWDRCWWNLGPEQGHSPGWRTSRAGRCPESQQRILNVVKGVSQAELKKPEHKVKGGAVVGRD